MPATAIKETWRSRTGNAPTVTKDEKSQVGYMVIGDNALTLAEAKAYAAANGPAADGTLVRDDIQCTELCKGRVSAIFTFVHPDKKEEDQQPADPSEFSFDTTGGSAHITTSLGTTSYPSMASPDYKNSINVTNDGVEGVDILAPKFSFQLKLVLNYDDATMLTYALTLAALTGTTNDDTFKGFAEGEVLFAGAVGSKRTGGNWEVTYYFEAEENITGLTIGDITGIEKKGWEYLWVVFVKYEDTALHMIVERPNAVYVEQVYYASDFSVLGV